MRVRIHVHNDEERFERWPTAATEYLKKCDKTAQKERGRRMTVLRWNRDEMVGRAQQEAAAGRASRARAEESVSQDQKIGCRDQRWGGRAGRIKEGKFRAGGSVGFRPRPPRSSRRDPGAGGSGSARPGLSGSTFLKPGSQDQAAENPLNQRSYTCQNRATPE